ncbi:MAG: DNA primase [Pelolinea sp.]|nr:DNA primase [Pelolinea sp.]
MNTVDEIKNRLDIVDIISEDVKLKRSGKNYTGFCPFHANTRTPAFVVFSDSGTWRCFGECNEGGDIFKYVMKKQGWDFREALKSLAERAGVKLEPPTPERKEQNERADQLRKLLEDAVIFYRHQLTQTEPGLNALEYLVEKRGITQKTAEAWGLGYAPQGWDTTLNYFLKKGYPQNDLMDVGLLSEKQEGGVFDRFRHRLMFPIRDANGGMAGFGGRVLNPEDVPKFMNSPQSLLFDKSRLLYGLDRARKAIRAANQAIIVEGYLDVVVVQQQGFENVISPMGTALTEAQMRMLKRFTRRFVLALDPDAAGVKATLRGLEVARDSLEHSSDVTLDARGLLHNEARLQADLRISALPEGLDPDEIVLRDPEEWKSIIENAKPIINHVFEMLVKNQDINDPKTKSEIAARILPLIRDVPNPVERNAYQQLVARVLQLDESFVLSLTTQKVRPRRRLNQADSTDGAVESRKPAVANVQAKVGAMEKQVLAYLVNDPEKIYQINRWLQKEALERLSIEDFSFTENRQAAEIVFKSIIQNDLDPAHFIQENISGELDFVLEKPANFQRGETEKEKKDASDRELEEVIRLVMQLRQTQVNGLISQLRFIQSNQEEPPDKKDQATQQQNFMKLIKMRGLLDKALAKSMILD